METTFRQEGARSFQAIHVHVSFLCLMVTFASACSFDASKLRAPSFRAPDGAIDHSADADAAPVSTGGAGEVAQVDSGATDQAPPTAGGDAALGQDGRDSSSANPDTALDAVIDYSADVDGVPADTGGAGEVGQVDFGAADQAPPAAGSDSAVGQDGQNDSDASPDTAPDGAIGTNPDTNAETNTGMGIVADGTYRVMARHSGKALDAYWEYTADGSNVDQWTYDGGKNQQWALTHLGGNVYEILGVQSGKALEVATTSTADDTNVDIRTYAGAANQQWTISALDGGYFRLTPVSSSGSALDVSGVSTADGANVHIWTWLGGTYYNQQWSFQSP